MDIAKFALFKFNNCEEYKDQYDSFKERTCFFIFNSIKQFIFSCFLFYMILYAGLISYICLPIVLGLLGALIVTIISYVCRCTTFLILGTTVLPCYGVVMLVVIFLCYFFNVFHHKEFFKKELYHPYIIYGSIAAGGVIVLVQIILFIPCVYKLFTNCCCNSDTNTNVHYINKSTSKIAPELPIEGTKPTPPTDVEQVEDKDEDNCDTVIKIGTSSDDNQTNDNIKNEENIIQFCEKNSTQQPNIPISV